MKVSREATMRELPTPSDVQLSIVRPGGDLENPIRMIIRVERGKTITLEILPHEFALALTGSSDRGAKMYLRNIEVKRIGGDS